jgi:hypothetical protein
LEKVACGAFSDHGFPAAGKRRDFRRLPRAAAPVSFGRKDRPRKIRDDRNRHLFDSTPQHRAAIMRAVFHQRSEERAMSKLHEAPSVRKLIERVFTGLAAVTIVAFVAVGTVAMCLPGAVVA